MPDRELQRIVPQPVSYTDQQRAALQAGAEMLGEHVATEDPYPNLASVRVVPKVFSVVCDSHSGDDEVVAVLTRGGRLVTDAGSVDWVRPGADAVLAPCGRCVGAASVRSFSVLKLKAARRSGKERPRLDDLLPDLASGSLSS